MKKLKIENWKIENCTTLIPKPREFILRRKSSARGPRFKSLIQRTMNRNWHTITVTHPSTNRGRCCLTPVYQAVGCSSMPRTPRNLKIIILLLKRYATPKSRSYFYLHFRPKDDLVVSIMVQGKSLYGFKMLRCLYVSGETPLKWGVSSGTWIQRVISLVPDSKQQQNTGQCLY